MYALLHMTEIMHCTFSCTRTHCKQFTIIHLSIRTHHNKHQVLQLYYQFVNTALYIYVHVQCTCWVVVIVVDVSMPKLLVMIVLL